MKILTVLLFVFGSCQLLWSQEIGTTTKDGKSYVIYIIKKGNTLYSLHNAYKVEVEEIVKANPGIENGLQIGQKIYIPIAEAPKDKTENVSAPTNGEEYRTHIVQRKETLYGISKIYNCSINELIALNPVLKDEELKTGQVIKIPSSKHTPVISDISGPSKEKKEVEDDPVFEVIYQDSLIRYTVQKGETLYSLSKRFMVPIDTLMKVNNLSSQSLRLGQIITIPLKKEVVPTIDKATVVESDHSIFTEAIVVEKKAQYNILVALPLKTYSNNAILSGIYDISSNLNSLTDISLDFMMGAKMAFDSLAELGLNAKVKFLDAKGDLHTLKKELSSGNNMDWDMIIGPFYPNLYEYAAQWGKTNKVPVIAVTQMPTKVFENNFYAFSVIPSDLTLLDGMAKYLAQNAHQDNVVLIKGLTEKENAKNAYFKDRYQQYLPSGSYAPIKETGIGNANGSTLKNYINVSKKSIFICLSNDVQRVMQFINALNAAKNISVRYGEADVVVVGLREWNEFTALNSYYKNRFKFHYADSKYIDYKALETIYFVQDFRAKYGTDPSKFAFHGFDAVLSQVSSLILGLNRNHGLSNFYDMHTMGAGNYNGKENTATFIIRQNNFELELLKIVAKDTVIDNINSF